MEESLSEDSIQEMLEELEEEQQSGQEPLSPDVEELLRELQSGRYSYTRSKAAEQLGRVDTSSPRIVQALLAACETDAHSLVREAAAKALSTPVHQEYLQEHPDLIERAEPDFEQAAAHRKKQRALEELEEEQQSGQEPLSPDVEELLRELESGRSAYTRSKAAEQLGRVDTSSPRIVQALLVARKADSHTVVRDAAARALLASAHQAVLQEHPDLIERAESDHREKQRALKASEDRKKQRAIAVRKARSRKEPKEGGWMPAFIVFGIVWVGVLAFVFVPGISTALRRTEGLRGTEWLWLFGFWGLVSLPGIAALAQGLLGWRAAKINREVLLRSMKKTVGTVEDLREYVGTGEHSSTSYHVTVLFEAEDAEMGTRVMVLKAKVAHRIWKGMKRGSTIGIQYAAEDPRIALIQGEW